MNIQENDDFLAAEFVLGVLDEPIRAQLERRLATDVEFAQQVTRWQKAFSGIDVTTQDVTPAPDVWWAIQRDINQSTPVAAAAPVYSRPTAWVGWALAAALASVLVFTYVTKPEQMSPMQPVAVLNGAQSGEQFVVSMNKSASIIQVSALNVTLPQSKNLQLWLIKGSNPPRSLGLITHNAGNEFKLGADSLDNQSVLAISLEPVGGSKLAGPSGPVIFQGKISTL
ncbi:anti-sigma factor [Scandinavium sp. TWS1a]|uniref:anti-sigma factor n=1 Tax=Scandinavium tedordense TaxID=2926521 RepID=UPI00135A64A9|nr:anti-sigma factor [Scandinavium tedordense]MCS2170540.1 anti-sigma factor [Scandinavium tedordense]